MKRNAKLAVQLLVQCPLGEQGGGGGGIECRLCLRNDLKTLFRICLHELLVYGLAPYLW